MTTFDVENVAYVSSYALTSKDTESEVRVLFKLMWGMVATSVKLSERSGLLNVRTTVGMSSVSFAALIFLTEPASVEEKTTL